MSRRGSGGHAPVQERSKYYPLIGTRVRLLLAVIWHLLAGPRETAVAYIYPCRTRLVTREGSQSPLSLLSTEESIAAAAATTMEALVAPKEPVAFAFSSFHVVIIGERRRLEKQISGKLLMSNCSRCDTEKIMGRTCKALPHPCYL